MNIVPTIAGIAFLLFGCYLLTQAKKSLGNARSSTAWPKTRGTITKMNLFGRRLVDGQEIPAKFLKAEYTYTVSEQQYESDKICFYTLVYPETTEFAEHHPIGATVDVYYNPNNPAESALITGPREGKENSDMFMAGLAITVGIVIAAAGLTGAIG